MLKLVLYLMYTYYKMVLLHCIVSTETKGPFPKCGDEGCFAFLLYLEIVKFHCVYRL